MKEPSAFFLAVLRAVKKIPRGKVATYGQLAGLASKPHAARGVSWILHSSSEKYSLPWHRVLNGRGKISFPEGTRNHSLQRERLEGEGIRFLDSGAVELARFQWKKKK